MTLDITFDYADIHSARTMASFLYGQNDASGMFNSSETIAELLDIAIARAMERVRTEMVEDAAGHVNLPRHIIDQKIELINRKASQGGAGIKISAKRIPIGYFGKPQQTRRGVQYRVSSLGRPWTAKGAFGPQIPRLGRHAFKRTTKGRLPIEKQFGPSLATILKKYKRRMPLFSKSSSSPWAMGLRKRIAREMKDLLRERLEKDAARMLAEDKKMFMDNWLQNVFAI